MLALVAALLAVYGAYAAWAALASHTLVWLPLAFLALLGAVGLFFNQRLLITLCLASSLLAGKHFKK